jgi:hypothetical protein
LIAGLLVGTVPLAPAIILLRRWYPDHYLDAGRPLRVIGGIVPGQRSDKLAFCFGLGIHLLSSGGLGIAFTAVADRMAGRGLVRRGILGAGLGTAQWLVGYYGFLRWYYPAQVEADPPWVAALTHAGFGAAVAVLT